MFGFFVWSMFLSVVSSTTACNIKLHNDNATKDDDDADGAVDKVEWSGVQWQAQVTVSHRQVHFVCLWTSVCQRFA